MTEDAVNSACGSICIDIEYNIHTNTCVYIHIDKSLNVVCIVQYLAYVCVYIDLFCVGEKIAEIENLLSKVKTVFVRKCQFIL